jgi:acetyl/propionyl-CoA carboxylase alpha subunit
MAVSLSSTHHEPTPAATIRPIRSLLIANRGEIAVRIARTARSMGIATVAVYSAPDAGAVHVEACDESVALGGDSAAETYLNAAKLIEAATTAGADAVHPGYGFLSENSEFAETVITAGLIWVGPRPETIATMGDKVAAKRMMAAAGVPVLEDVVIVDGTDVREAAAALTPPIIVKAAAGGGGKGMRIVTDLAELPAMVEACRREAAGAFGDDRVFLERFLTRPRHIEVQIAGDRYGHVIHLFERECSIQRRHQKVIEESPSAVVDDALRDVLCSAAVAAGETLGYEGAGTVEFVLGGDGEPAFLEVNTRLQVEHPVTEAVTGIDLVRLQLLVAEGRPLPVAQADVTRRGHAIEARLYAEDPARGYLPAAGPIVCFRPGGADDVRWDAGVRTGSVISPHYDPMLAKVIAWAETRDEAARALERALRTTHLHGPATNRDLLCAVLAHRDFLAGALTTGFLDDHFPTDDDRTLPPGSEVLQRAAVVAALTAEARRSAGQTLPSGWRNNRAIDQTVAFDAGERIDLAYRLERDGTWRAEVGDRTMRVERRLLDEGAIDVSLDGHTMTAFASSAQESDGMHWEVTGPRGSAHLIELPRFPDPAPPDVAGATRAPMHGQVVSVAVTAGDRVARGQLLCIVEAMKMEQQLVAPYDAVVTSVEVAAGDGVETDQVLAVLEEQE